MDKDKHKKLAVKIHEILESCLYSMWTWDSFDDDQAADKIASYILENYVEKGQVEKTTKNFK